MYYDLSYIELFKIQTFIYECSFLYSMTNDNIRPSVEERKFLNDLGWILEDDPCPSGYSRCETCNDMVKSTELDNISPDIKKGEWICKRCLNTLLIEWDPRY